MPAKVGQYTTLVVEDVDLSKASRRDPLLTKTIGRKVLHKAPTPSPCSGLADGVPLRPTLEEKPATTPCGLALESLTASVQSDPGKASSRQPRRGEQVRACARQDSGSWGCPAGIPDVSIASWPLMAVAFCRSGHGWWHYGRSWAAHSVPVQSWSIWPAVWLAITHLLRQLLVRSLGRKPKLCTRPPGPAAAWARQGR